MYRTYVFWGLGYVIKIYVLWELWDYLLYCDLGWCPRPYYDACGCATCDSCALVFILLLLFLTTVCRYERCKLSKHEGQHTRYTKLI